MKKYNPLPKKNERTVSFSSPRNSRRGCLCRNRNEYSVKCCDGLLIEQGIGNINAAESRFFYTFREDPFAGYLSLAVVGSTFDTQYQNDFGVTSAWDDVSPTLRGNGLPQTPRAQSIGLFEEAGIAAYSEYVGSTFVSGGANFNPISSTEFDPFSPTYEDFTIESWINFGNDNITSSYNLPIATKYIPGISNIPNSEYVFDVIDNKLRAIILPVSINGGYRVVGGFNPNLELIYTSSVQPIQNDTWHHVALVKYEQNISMYFDGEQIVSASVPYTIRHASSAGSFKMFGKFAATTDTTDVYFNDYRYYLGVAKYRGNFTTPQSMVYIDSNQYVAPAIPQKEVFCKSWYNLPSWEGFSTTINYVGCSNEVTSSFGLINSILEPSSIRPPIVLNAINIISPINEFAPIVEGPEFKFPTNYQVVGTSTPGFPGQGSGQINYQNCEGNPIFLLTGRGDNFNFIAKNINTSILNDALFFTGPYTGSCIP